MTKYGYFECRSQFQKSQGIWAAFWIQSIGISAGEDPGKYGTEIDIFEFFKGFGDVRNMRPLHNYLKSSKSNQFFKPLKTFQSGTGASNGS